MKRLNNVVIKLWLTILLIVTTVLILLSAALITFMQYYFTQQTENTLFENAKSINQVLDESKDRQSAIRQSDIMLEKNKGLIIIPDFVHFRNTNSIKEKMLEEIKENKAFDKVLSEKQSVLQHITVNVKGIDRTYVLLGYPAKDYQGQASAVFIYQDLKSIEDTNNVITIIILITALIFLGISTVFAFFLSTRITNPLRDLQTQAREVARGNYAKRVPVQTKDEIGALAMTFNKMSRSIQTHIDAITTSKNIRDTLIDAMVEGVLGMNHRREIILSNQMATNLLQEMPKDLKDKYDAQANQTFKTRRTEYQEYEINKRYFVIIMSYIERIQPTGESGLVVVMRDMTNEHHMDQVKKDFIASVSHELRTPISLLQGYTESIVDGVVTEPDEIREFLLIVLDESRRLSRLVNELLDVAKIDAEGVTVSKTEQPMQDLIQKMAIKYKQEALDLGLTLNFQMDGIMTCNWQYDFDRMEQVLTNLVDNAARHTKPGDCISISATETATDFILTVSDTGVGISPEHLEKVFDRFYKVDASRKRGKQGTGLGLFITRMIVEAHGGHISVMSKVNIGTQFKIKLPKG
ncbi:ATP-binding protein [Staphylococcus hyicus]|uniref:Sensor protein SrrB n=2 Tax=Staphylococcus hyicus TaxID=1284 RepID=A0A0A8HTC1_STAHY|nr:ATP-binding protein [Staphylococcus hyicus]AJC96164.1 signal transduction histidine kinase SrrB [Staphylococcus hyicus]MDP4447948.1 ATP-binding protein [Staphylococcus hyicus]MDP4462233.1 ATP-binding protein [Staphylococcus hyicus]NJH81298.1 HAMP domain-containing protein [Staphylococcus hyicus]NJI00368.1 HAMP domain-containing protein [Staphylococcus hyicus]